MLSESVTIKKLRALKYVNKDGKKANIDIIERASHKWRKITDLISGVPNKASTLQQECLDPCQCLRQVLIDCFIDNAPEGYTQNWSGLIELLEDADSETLAREVECAILNPVI